MRVDLPAGFLAHVCGWCGGKGEYRQHYNVGCGGGLFEMTVVCDRCGGTGLMQGDRPAPASVRHQVLNAAKGAAP